MTEMMNTFEMKNGKVITRQKQRYVKTGKQGDFSSSYAKKEVHNELDQMKWEIGQSEKSSSTLINDGFDRVSHRSFTPSTFPEFMRRAGINSKKDFSKVIKSKKGIRFNRLKDEAISRLENGYQNQHGRDDPNKKFLVKTGQLHDNKDVIFRRIRGRIVPIRVKKKNRFDLMEEAPF